MDEIDKAVKGLDFSPIIDELEKTNQEEKVVASKERDDKGKFVARDQFKTEEDRIKGYKELQGFATKVSQENKTLKEQLSESESIKQQMAEMKEQLELSRLAQQSPQPQYQQRPFNEIYQENPEIAIEQRIQQTVATTRIAEVLEELSLDKEGRRDPEFDERYAYAKMVSQQYPQLSTTATGVKKLFDLGDKLRKENLRKQSGKALEAIFGSPLTEEESARLVKLVKGDKVVQKLNNQSDAYMPDTSTSTKIGSDQNQQPNFESRLQESVTKGDVDGTINALLRGKLAG